MEIISATKKVCLIRKLSHHPKYLTLSGKFWHIQGFFWIIKNIQDYPETFQTTRKLSRLSENFPGYLETFQTIWKYPDYPETFRMAMPWCHDGFWASERLEKGNSNRWNPLLYSRESINCNMNDLKWNMGGWTTTRSAKKRRRVSLVQSLQKRKVNMDFTFCII